MRFPDYYAGQIEKRSIELCKAWFDRLAPLLGGEATEIFPSERLLDQIPAILQQIASYLRPDVPDDVQTASSVTEKARELGYFRFDQGASTHQILREFELLAEVLEEHLELAETSAPIQPTASEMREVSRKLHHMVRVLLQASVDAFTERYSDMIEAQQAKIQAFNRAIAHEIRNPLNTLKIASELLREDMSPEGTQRVASLIHDSVDRIVDQVRVLERLTAEERPVTTPTRQEIDVTALARDLAEQLSEMAEARGVEVRVAPDLPVVESDLHLLEMIFLNLVANGIKYSDPAKKERFVSIDATVDASVEDERALRIVVADNGLGIADDQHEAIFARHFRGRPDEDEALGNTGSGLGLAIVRECVDALEGTVEVDSEEGVGSTFTVLISV